MAGTARERLRAVRRRVRAAGERAAGAGGGDRRERDRRLLAELAQTRDAVTALAGQTERLTEVQRALHAGVQELREWLSNVQTAQDVLVEQVGGLSARVAGDFPLHGPGTAFALETFDAGLGGRVVGFRDRPAGDAGPAVYLGFEDSFRGSEQSVTDRQRAYLPLLSGRGPLLDIGCGRGEMLALMAEIGVEARGIDVDPAMIERCAGKGLERVEVADAVSGLGGLADGSLGAIVAMQVIEHLPYPELIALLRASTAKLRPGGRMIVETVNPHCAQALKHFWIDPTHQHPLYPETVVALCGLVGFAEAFVWYPGGTGDPDRDRGRRPDFAVVAQTRSS
jgi:2-polyprenyl-3-methyl-5-hydroxy-6-metoxy-1,4-benzoquinol methylase